MNVTVTQDGWFSSLPVATSDFVMRKFMKAQTSRTRPVNVRVSGRGIMRAHFDARPTTATLADADKLAQGLAHVFRHVPPWVGVDPNKRSKRA
jgi:hypothetical protein